MWKQAAKYDVNKMYLWNTMPLTSTKSEKAIFRVKVQVKVTDLDVIWKSIIVEYACQVLQFKSYSQC